MEYLQLVETKANNIADDCYNDWRYFLSDKREPTQNYQSICECMKNTNSLCNECVKCQRCEKRWKPETQQYSIHGSYGDYEKWKEVYIAKVIPSTWYDKNKANYTFGWQDFQKENVTLMNEKEAIQKINNVLEVYPNVKAWITLEFLQIAMNLRWKKMIKIATKILENRQQYFTMNGIYKELSMEDASRFHKYHEYNNMTRIEVTPLAEDGLYCQPLYLTSSDSSASTINIDHNLQDWLEKITNKKKLIKLLGRAIASSSAQWLVEECESFYRNEQHNVIGIIAHDDNKMSYTCSGSSMFGKNIIWHTKETKNKCVICNDSSINPETKLSPYEKMLDNARRIRRNRLRGVFWCSIKLLYIMRSMRWYCPNGIKYKEALNHFNQLKQMMMM
jgi:hypothetical protein